MHTYIANGALAWARPGSWSLGPSPVLPARCLGPGPDPAWDWAQGSPGLWPRFQGLCPAHLSALLIIYVCIFYAIYRSLMYFT